MPNDITSVPTPVSERDYRDTVGLFSTGVAVIVAVMAEEVYAITVNAVASLSLNPRLIMFAPDKKTRFAERIGELKHYSINLLRDEQQALSTYFSGGWKQVTPPPFRFVRANLGLKLEGSLACIECTCIRQMEAGDHWIVVGRADSLHRGVPPHRPLVFYNGRYRDLDWQSNGFDADFSDRQNLPAHIYYPA
jgi:flavin reductase (DIM6/NTAB) family NADH-FMN oxidoreductase RutF